MARKKLNYSVIKTDIIPWIKSFKHITIKLNQTVQEHVNTKAILQTCHVTLVQSQLSHAMHKSISLRHF